MLSSFFRPRPASQPDRGRFPAAPASCGHHADGRDIDPFARDLDGRDLGHWLAMSRDAHAVAGSGALDQLAADARHARAVRVGDPRILLVARRRSRIWLSNSMHAGCRPVTSKMPLGRREAAVACGSERDHRTAVGGVRGLQQARSVRVPDRPLAVLPQGHGGKRCHPAPDAPREGSSLHPI